MREEVKQALLSRVIDAGGYIDFDGKNCDPENECRGWNGEDRRCDCGNRRVYWELADEGDENDPDNYCAIAW